MICLMITVICMTNQCQRVLSYIDEHGSITSLEAINKLGITRLSARIKDIKDSGIKIVDDWVYVPTRFDDETRVKRYYRGVQDVKT